MTIEAMRELFVGLIYLLCCGWLVAGIVLLLTGFINGSTYLVVGAVSLSAICVAAAVNWLYKRINGTNLSDGEEAARACGFILCIYGAYNILVGLAALVIGLEIFGILGLGIFQLIGGSVLVILGIATARRSLLALTIAIGIIAADLLYLIYSVYPYLASWLLSFGVYLVGIATIAVGMRLYMLVVLVSGIKVLRRPT